MLRSMATTKIRRVRRYSMRFITIFTLPLTSHYGFYYFSYFDLSLSDLDHFNKGGNFPPVPYYMKELKRHLSIRFVGIRRCSWGSIRQRRRVDVKTNLTTPLRRKIIGDPIPPSISLMEP